MIPVLRVLIGDTVEANQTYTDDSLEQTIVVAAKQVAASVTFGQAYTATLATVKLTPDPTAVATKDEAFVNLVTLKAAAILDRTEASLAARRGIIVKDGGAAIDLSKVAEAKRKLLERGGWNAAYEDAKFEYLYYRAQCVAGAAVLTPFRLYAWESFGMSTFAGDPRARNLFQ
jgi:hypothetical protein